MSPFFNPYAFVPAPARSPDDDGPPRPLGVLDDSCWTGTLRLEISAVSPLLIIQQDAKLVTKGDKKEEKQRRTRMVRGEVAVPPTSLKGMIRSEFEMVTNSRFAVFDAHSARLGHRIRAAQPASADLVPVYMTDAGDTKRAVLLPGRSSGRTANGRDALAAAWVPRYRGQVVSDDGIAHGYRVFAWVILMLRRHRNGQGQWVDSFLYWRVVDMGLQRRPRPAVDAARHCSQGRTWHEVVDPEPVEISGFYVKTGQNTENKYNERIFFAAQLLDNTRGLQSAEIGPDVIAEWGALLDSYAAAAKIASPSDSDPGVEKSRHRIPEVMAELRPLPKGTLCYAEFESERLARLFPVALSRQLYDVAPSELAATARLSPAEYHRDLSPADRLFGWVSSERDRADRPGTQPLRGRVRLGPVTTEKATLVKVDKGLAILGQPRPTQDLFYAAQDDQGRPLTSSPGYREGQGLRGRKVYPHQPLTTFRQGRRQSWLLHGTGDDVGDQNARLVDMVAEGAEFTVDLHIENLTNDELGALLWVLRGRSSTDWQRRYHKLGGGKPLGFGTVTVRVNLEDSDVRDTAAWLSYYALDDEPGGRSLDERIAEDRVMRAVDRAPQRVRDAYDAYLAGFPAGTPVHYPEDPRNPGSDEKRYAWFVDNRHRGAGYPLGELGGRSLALPDRPRGDGR